MTYHPRLKAEIKDCDSVLEESDLPESESEEVSSVNDHQNQTHQNDHTTYESD